MRLRKKQKEINQKGIIVKKERLIQISISLKTILYIIVILFLLSITWYLLYFKWIYVYLNYEKNKYESFLFSVLVSMTLLMFQLACGFDINFSNKYFRLFTICIVISMVYYGYYNYGLGIIVYRNFGLLDYNIYESNSKHGLLFFIRNWLFWSYIFVASLILMTRDK